MKKLIIPAKPDGSGTIHDIAGQFDRSDNLGDEIETALAESARLMRQARGGNEKVEAPK